jgi:esterase
VHLNEFAATGDPHDMTSSDEFASLLASAADLGISHSPDIGYRSANVVVRHHRFHYLEWGSPDLPDVLLLHGSNQSAHSWDLVSLHLADRFHVIALDQRGHGDSEWARDVDYSSTAMAADAAAVAHELGLVDPIVIGHSMGGMNTMRMLLDHPDRASKVVLVDIGPELSEQGANTIRSFIVENREFDDLDTFINAVQKYDKYRPREHIERTVKYNLLQRADGKYISKRDHGPRLETTRLQRDRSDRFTLDDAATFDLPVLLVRGADSQIFTAEAADRFVGVLPRGKLITVPNSGHNVQGQNTPGFIEAITAFISPGEL